MTLASPKGTPAVGTVAFPRSLSSMAASIVGLAIFLVLASFLLVSYPIGSTVQGYFNGVGNNLGDHSLLIDHHRDSNVDLIDKEKPNGSDLKVPNRSTGINNTNVDDIDKKSLPLEAKPQASLSVSGQEKVAKVKEASVISNASSGGVSDGSDDTGSSIQSDPKLEVKTDIYAVPSHATKTGSDYPGCDLYHGSWFYDSLGPLYTNNTCPVLTQMQNCQGNGRPDKEYENWRWKPFQCDLPRFDARKFLELMRGKTLAFIGDSVARNQMESMLCLLWQVETPKNRGNKRMQRFYFRSTSTMIVRIWSSWLVRKRSDPLDFAPEGVVKLHLDAPDDDFMEYVPSFDVIVLSSGHWFAKQSVYVLNNEIMGGQLWWPDKSREMKINNVEAFGISVETILTALATHPNYTGLTILRSYSPDHYEGGAWNTGGSCTGKVKPLEPGKLVENGFTDTMHKKQIEGFNRAVKKATNKSKLRLMDITEVFSYRHDGHPGPYRSPDPNKQTKRGPDGRPPPQDCLHWCMPGPVDTWNEFVLETIRREYEGEQSSLQFFSPHLEPWRHLPNKVVLVTGASSGLGRDFCLDLAKDGCKIVAAARRFDRLKSLCDEINQLPSSSSSSSSFGPRAVAVELDITADGPTIERSVKPAWDAFSRIDALINNAGIRGNVKDSLELSEEEWDNVVKTNLTGSWLVSKYVCIRMRDSKIGGSVINISSIAGLNRGQLPGAVAYSASKSGVNDMTKMMALELGAHKIRVNITRTFQI